MALTQTQLAALKADIAADPTLSAQPNTPDGDDAIAAAYNLPAAGPYIVWCSSVPGDTVFNAITWANLTPADAIPTDTQLNVAIWSARSLCCQGKQFNLQTLLVGKDAIACKYKKVRDAFTDALTSIPSGNNGNLKDAGSAAVTTLFQRTATRAEKLFASGGAGTAASPSDLNFEGALAWQDVAAARNS